MTKPTGQPPIGQHISEDTNSTRKQYLMKDNRALTLQRWVVFMFMTIRMKDCSHFGSSTSPQQLGGWKQDHGKGCAT
eukprot:14708409-Heterocapsa_arctica.AAC.1